MSLFARFMSPCIWSHASDPLIVMLGTQARFECRRCSQDLGAVLSGQMYPVRPLKALKAGAATEAECAALKAARDEGQPHRLLPMVGRKKFG